MLPFHDAFGVSMKAIHTEDVREFRGKPKSASHSYDLLLGLEDIKHRTSKIAVRLTPSQDSGPPETETTGMMKV